MERDPGFWANGVDFVSGKTLRHKFMQAYSLVEEHIKSWIASAMVVLISFREQLYLM